MRSVIGSRSSVVSQFDDLLGYGVNQKREVMSLFPLFLKLEGKRCVVAGAGRIGEGKIRSLLIAHAEVRVIAPQATPTVLAWERAGVLRWDAREFEASDLADTFLVVAATSSEEVNERVYREAQARRVLCNVVDDPERCDFYYGSVVRRGNLQVAISTEGQSPALAQRLRKEVEKQIGPEYAGWLAELGEAREELFAKQMDPEERRVKLHELASRGAFEARRDAVKTQSFAVPDTPFRGQECPRHTGGEP